MILTQAQAEAVYSAMCALNNVGGILHTRIKATPGAFIHVNKLPSGHMQLWPGDAGGNPTGPLESHHNQAAFATAYGLISDEPQSDVAAAAGGLTQTACEY